MKHPHPLPSMVFGKSLLFGQGTTPIRGGNPAEHLCNWQLKWMIGQENPQRGQVLGMFHDGAVAKNGAWVPLWQCYAIVEPP